MTIRGHSYRDPDDPDAYWRRRFFILGGGLGVLMLLAWLFASGGPSKQARQTAAVQASVAARQNQDSLPSPALGTAYGARPSPSATPFPTVSGSPTASGSPSASDSPSASKTPSAAGKASSADKACPAGSVVLSLFTGQPAYSPGQQPTFDIYAVSTSSSPCELKYGPAAVRVVVTRHGKVVWDSAACKAASNGSKTVRMAPGVPQQAELTWNRGASSRSCAGTLSKGEWGTFEAVAHAYSRSTPSRSFKLTS
jgi:hypothetical protein